VLFDCGDSVELLEGMGDLVARVLLRCGGERYAAGHGGYVALGCSCVGVVGWWQR
jgi:hypothetical protein